MKPDYRDILSRLRLPGRLSGYDAVVIGTPPLGIHVVESDIDIACSADDLPGFGRNIERLFGSHERFALKSREVHGESAVIANFACCGWIVEIFCQSLPVGEQWGVRHFQVEKRLLELAPALHPLILNLKQRGMKTEPAFASVLGLSGDPYEALLELESADDDTLAGMADRSVSAYAGGRRSADSVRDRRLLLKHRQHDM